MVGSAATSPNRGQANWTAEFADIYKRILPTVIGLSVDADPACKSLFHKLLYQLLHWFSGSNQVHVDEAAALVDALIDGLSDSQSGSVRDQCARGLCEFFKYVIKQNTKKELARNPASAEEILRRLFVIAAHPTEECRIGAAVVFNKLYVILREETSLVEKYALQVLFILVKALRLGGSESTIEVNVAY